MHEKKFHRNSQKRFYGDGKIYFIVTKTFKNHPYFKEPMFCDLLIEELKLCKKIKQFNLYGFCLIYDHLNLLIQPNDEFNISKVMKSLKENISRDINYVIGGIAYKGDTPLYEGDTSTCRLHIRALIKNFHKQFIKKYNNPQFEIPKFKWQKSFYDHVVRGKKDFQNHYRYAVYNYIKHKLPEDWQYTSLNYEEMIDVIEW